MGFPRQAHWSGLLSPPEDLPSLGIEPTSPVSPALQMDSFPTEFIGKALYTFEDHVFSTKVILYSPALRQD